MSNIVNGSWYHVFYDHYIHHCFFLHTEACCCAATVLAVIVTLLSFGLVSAILVLYPMLQHSISQPALAGDTIQLNLPVDSYWIESIDIQLLATSQQCSADIVSAYCEDLSAKLTANITTNTTLDYIYLNKGSSISFTPGDEEGAYPYFVWVFEDYHVAERAAEFEFYNMACTDPPKHSYCVKISDSTDQTSLKLNHSSYYFLRCEGDHSCSKLKNWTFHKCNYDIEQAKEIALSESKLELGSAEYYRIDLDPQQFHRLLKTKQSEICVVASLSSGDCGNCSVNVSNYITLRQSHGRMALLIFPFTIGMLVSSASVGIFICHLAKVHKRRKCAKYRESETYCNSNSSQI